MEDKDWKSLAANFASAGMWRRSRRSGINSASRFCAFSRLGNGEALAFLRLQWKNGPPDYRVAYANELFSVLLAQSWTAEIENEAFAR